MAPLDQIVPEVGGGYAQGETRWSKKKGAFELKKERIRNHQKNGGVSAERVGCLRQRRPEIAGGAGDCYGRGVKKHGGGRGRAKGKKATRS